MENTEKTPHIAIVPSPGMGHLIPLVEFAKRLVHNHDFTVSFVIPTDGPPSKAQELVLDRLPTSISHVFLPPVNFDDLPETAGIETRIILMVTRSLSSIRTVLKAQSESNNLVALVVDLFGTDTFPVAREFNVPPYVFFTAAAMCLSFIFYIPELDKRVKGEYRDLTEPVQIPGCKPINGIDLLDPVQDRNSDTYKYYLQNAINYRTAEGIMVNSFTDLESGAIKSLQAVEPGNPPVYPVGPLVNMVSGGGNDGLECLKWLDDQPYSSVLFVSFGSGGSLSSAQLNELAYGLEMSEQRFLWVARSPSDLATNATYFSAQSISDPLSFLPEGFLERTKGKGLVVPNWAPQSQILNHGSTGGFLTHCGWNSTLESVVSGIPLIAWPLYAEQKMNAVMLTQEIKVALRPKVSQDKGLIEREEIGRVVKSLMEGEEGKNLRSRMKNLKDAAWDVLSEDGASTKALAELANNWKNRQTNNQS